MYELLIDKEKRQARWMMLRERISHRSNNRERERENNCIEVKKRIKDRIREGKKGRKEKLNSPISALRCGVGCT